MKKGGFLWCESMEEESWSGWPTDASPGICSWKPPWVKGPVFAQKVLRWMGSCLAQGSRGQHF